MRTVFKETLFPSMFRWQYLFFAIRGTYGYLFPETVIACMQLTRQLPNLFSPISAYFLLSSPSIEMNNRCYSESISVFSLVFFLLVYTNIMYEGSMLGYVCVPFRCVFPFRMRASFSIQYPFAFQARLVKKKIHDCWKIC